MCEQTEETQKEEEPFGLGCALELFAEVEEVLGMIDNLKNIINSQKSIVERAHEKFQYILNQYHEQPHLLDRHIDEILERLTTIVRDPENDMKLKHETFKYMFVVINVRGYKIIVRHLPHEVSDFEPVLQLLEKQTPTDPETWTTRYVLLLWLSIIVMIPFHMCRLDADDTEKTVMSRVLDVCKTYAVVTDKCRDAAAFLASKFLTRVDVKEQYLASFFDWACELSVAKDSGVFIKYGALASIAMIMKHGKREDLLPYARKLLQWVINAEFKGHSGANVQKLVYKIVQRIGLTFLPPRVAAWRYQRGNRSLTANLSAGGDTTTPSTVELASSTVATEEEAVEDVEVPDEIEEIIDQLIQGLGSEDSVVRWSAAKGIGRVTGRLPKDLADEVVGSVLLLFSPRESDSSWHGGCLALAELGRRGLLLPQRLPEVVPVVLKALLYDEPRGYASVGSHIRDAACYVCWSFARAYETHILKPFVNDIASTLLIMACFDKEINCRRAASAAFQENVGRQGSFPHGIEILTTADFYAVSVRNNAYLNISVFVAQFEEYTLPLINHLLQRKVDHWDLAIRELSAKALHNLTPLASEHMINIVLPALFDKTRSIDLNTRHGSVLAIGEILFALSKVAKEKGKKIGEIIDENLLESSKNLIPYFRERLYFRGMGGELMKQACSDFIEKCSSAHMPFHDSEVIEDWLTLLNECLLYEVPVIRTAAITALPVFLNEYFQNKKDKQAQIISSYKSYLFSVYNQVERMGHALALGALPKFMLREHVKLIIDALVDSTEINEVTLKWAEFRRDAIKALTSICVTMSENIGSELTDEHIHKMYDTFLCGLTEYTQDNRGDIGAWVREASMSGLQTLTLLLVKEQKSNLLSASLVSKIMASIAQQAVEKIDRTRALAGKIFYNLIHNEPIVPNIPNHDALKNIFGKDECEVFNWNSAAATFPKFVQLIQFPDYTYHMILGLVSSVGGMTETLVKSSSSSLFAYLRSEEEKKGCVEIKRICDAIYDVFFNYQKTDRIIVSMFRFLDRLMSSGCIGSIINDVGSDFPQKTLKLIQVEIAGCRDIYKLIDGINVLCQFVQIKSEVSKTALVQLSILLCHRQSYVRRSTSTRLYESLLVYGDNSVIPPENLDEIMNILSTTNWEQSVDDVKPIRNNLCALMKIRVPVPKKKVDPPNT